jgi:hypothetical protein
LRVEHHAPCAAGHGGGGGVRADAARGPHRHVELGHQPLHQHERAQLADPPAGLEPPGHQAAGATAQRLPRLGLRGHLGQHAPPAVPPGPGRIDQARIDQARIDQHRIDRRREVVGAERRSLRYPHPERPVHAVRHSFKGGRAGRVIGAEVQNAEVTGPRDGHHQVGVRFEEWRYSYDKIAKRADPRHVSLTFRCGGGQVHCDPVSAWKLIALALTLSNCPVLTMFTGLRRRARTGSTRIYRHGEIGTLDTEIWRRTLCRKRALLFVSRLFHALRINAGMLS